MVERTLSRLAAVLFPVDLKTITWPAGRTPPAWLR